MLFCKYCSFTLKIILSTCRKQHNCNINCFQTFYEQRVYWQCHCSTGESIFDVICRSYWHILNENFKISTKLATKPPHFLNITCIKDYFADNPCFANFVENLKNKFEFLKSSLPDAYFCRLKISIRPIIWMLILGLRLINSQFLFRVMKI